MSTRRPWLAHVLVLFVACGEQSGRAPTLLGEATSDIGLLGFDSDSTLLARIVVWNETDDTQALRCEHTGIYRIFLSGRIEARFQSQELCEILARSQEVSLTPDGGSLLFADSRGAGSIAEYELARSVYRIKYSACAPTIGTPVWSPTGSMIAMVAPDCTLPDRGWPALLHKGAASPEYLSAALSATEGSPHFSWAPDGSAFALQQDDALGGARVLIYDLRTRVAHPLVRGRFPAWGPQAIAYATDELGVYPAWTIHIARRDGATDGELVRSTQVARSVDPLPSLLPPMLWHPSDGSLVFVAGQSVWRSRASTKQPELIYSAPRRTARLEVR